MIGHQECEFHNLTLVAAIEKTVKRVPEKIAAIFPVENVKKSFSELWNDSEKLAAGMIAMNMDFNPGDKVAICAAPSYKWLVVKYAILRLGLVVVPLNHFVDASQKHYFLHLTECRAVFADQHFSSEPDISNNNDKYSISNIISLKDDNSNAVATSFEKLMKMGQICQLLKVQQRSSMIKPQDAAAILQSSGSTGLPKAIVVSHTNMVHNSYLTRVAMEYPDDTINLVPMPIFHAFGFLVTEGVGMVNGFTSVYPPLGSSPEELLKIIANERCTVLHGTSATLLALAHAPERPNYDISSLKYGMIGGAVLHPSIISELVEKLGYTKLKMVYGLTETCGIMSCADALNHTGYKIFPEIEVRIVDENKEPILENHTKGEIQIKGPTVFMEYINHPEKTAATISPDGWLSTGDIGYHIGDGKIEITGRKCEMIYKGDLMITPKEVESVILSHLSVEEVSVVSIPDKSYGEEICAWVKLVPGKVLIEGSLTEICRLQLDEMRRPKHIVIVDNFPKTSIGKISKLRIREETMNMLQNKPK